MRSVNFILSQPAHRLAIKLWIATFFDCRIPTNRVTRIVHMVLSRNITEISVGLAASLCWVVFAWRDIEVIYIVLVCMIVEKTFNGGRR